MKKPSMIIMLLCVMIHSAAVAQSTCKMLFFDDFFDNRFNWAITDHNRNVSYSLENGYYYIEGLKKSKASITLQQLDVDESKNFEIEASIKKISTAEKNGYGICLGFSNALNHFGFIINDKGEFKYYERKNAKTNNIIPWTACEHIKKDIGSTTRLMIKKEDEVLKFYINGSLVAEKPFQRFPGNKFGFYLQRKQKIAVDYFRALYSHK